MRCQKLRSCLPAYCNGELNPRAAAPVARHLESCPACQREFVAHANIAQGMNRIRIVSVEGISDAAPNATLAASDSTMTNDEMKTTMNRKNLTPLRVSQDFNERLLNRIAHERYAETRTAAYLPKRTPLFGWTRIAAFGSTVAAVALVSVVALKQSALVNPDLSETASNTSGASSSGATGDYFTALPVNNPLVNPSSLLGTAVSSPSPSSGGASLASSTVAGENWTFAGDWERTQKILFYARSMGSSHRDIPSFDRTCCPLDAPSIVVYVDPITGAVAGAQFRVTVRPILPSRGATPTIDARTVSSPTF